MYITKIILDGFKSYATRTEITDFDSSFNAITGLNGSGKSNILDSICFVLGITNLSHVRANNLQELIYKSGQAGIERATVSIVFDNSNQSQSPVGYESSREITITRQVYKQQGKNRYLINGTVVPSNKVKDFFGSVSLNVNNPHFLIMQGRVTKVLNMKPPEILSMLEEATGTRMYEDKKRDTQRTIEKKDAKLEQIDTVLREDLEPQMQKLAEERQAFVKYNTVCRQLDQLQKVHTAYQYVRTEKKLDSLNKESNQLLQNIEDYKLKIEELKADIERAKVEAAEMEKTQDQECGAKLSGLEEALKSVELSHAKCESDLKHIREQIQGEEKVLKENEKITRDAETQIKAKRAAIEKINSTVGGTLREKEEAEKALELAEKHLEALAMGMTTNEQGVAATVTEQLRQAEVESASCADDIRALNHAIQHLEGRLKATQKELTTTENHFKKDSNEINDKEKIVKKLQDRINALHFDRDRLDELDCEKQSLAPKLLELRKNVDNFDARNQNLVFNYSDPYPGFDRKKVIGPVCQLFKVRDPKWDRAIEAAAGGKLYHVIVDSDETAKDLLKNGRLQRRVTIIALNKVRGSFVDDQTIRSAKQLVGDENIHKTVDLIEYDKRYETCMKYVFGKTLVAASLDIAEKAAYDRRVNTKTLSICGSTCDPSGMLSGGSVAPGPSVLEKLQKRREDVEQLSQLQQRYDGIVTALKQMEGEADTYNKIHQELMVRTNEWEQCKARLANTKHAQLSKEVESSKAELEEKKVTLKAKTETKTSADARIKELQLRMKNTEGQQDKEKKEAEASLKKYEKIVKAATQKCGAEERRLQELQGDIDVLTKEIEEAQQSISACNEVVVELKKQYEAQEKKLSGIKEGRDKAKSMLEAHKSKMKAQSSEIGSRYKEIDRKQKQIDAKKLEIQQTEHDVKEKRKESSDVDHRLRRMASEHPWISKDRAHFGEPNTDYDFSRTDPNEVSKKVAELSSQKEKMSKTVNARAHTQANNLESQYKDLTKKRAQVEKDRESIMNVMRELDMKKEDTIRGAYDKVNKDFGDIFTSLLEGASAKLVPPAGKTLLDGLEVKVSFGGVWKESLSELSGGQRSLVALSLILALLLFRPAPIYILDEVDAALDLAHTQNIGLMIKNHFKSSQFIIVSLKDGLFSNANVLFRTKFVDGKSTVERFVSKSS
ncbi:structural maintenance of chromosomes protein 2 [Galendromus occidentalis]|uniref:Structural maintenance of chromosomes protein n=1 Tax=Galendromus occidentalis TaxID=34638 RepID=A0AAJ7L5B2_9ACAR|nr:structural maintenance of chromosomes protein 2 [Galendromus occidentalis]